LFEFTYDRCDIVGFAIYRQFEATAKNIAESSGVRDFGSISSVKTRLFDSSVFFVKIAQELFDILITCILIRMLKFINFNTFDREEDFFVGRQWN
jgi:hypothetical protein